MQQVGSCRDVLDVAEVVDDPQTLFDLLVEQLRFRHQRAVLGGGLGERVAEMPARHELVGHVRDDVIFVPQVARQAFIEDVDGDGDDGLVLHFKPRETSIVCGDTSASLTGKMFSG
jgi:hypothetical protein